MPGAHHLERHLAAQAQVAGAVDLAHAAVAQEAEDLVTGHLQGCGAVGGGERRQAERGGDAGAGLGEGLDLRRLGGGHRHRRGNRGARQQVGGVLAQRGLDAVPQFRQAFGAVGAEFLRGDFAAFLAQLLPAGEQTTYARVVDHGEATWARRSRVGTRLL